MHHATKDARPGIGGVVMVLLTYKGGVYENKMPISGSGENNNVG
jgi:hypothetical protein